MARHGLSADAAAPDGVRMERELADHDQRGAVQLSLWHVLVRLCGEAPRGQGLHQDLVVVAVPARAQEELRQSDVRERSIGLVARHEPSDAAAVVGLSPSLEARGSPWTQSARAPRCRVVDLVVVVVVGCAKGAREGEARMDDTCQPLQARRNQAQDPEHVRRSRGWQAEGRRSGRGRS